ncbi:hypothetical protein QP157_20695 [Sphingomonas sp. LR61]|uniref:ABC transporter permease subunit n=1 Tax=Sphingomonas sp. LR61 TaxID=3050234 RepID=UPI002FE25E67
MGLVVIWVAFGLLTPGGSFLYATNLVDLAVQCAAAGTISIGIVLVLLLGEIDLSVGSVSGLAAAILGVGLTQLHWPLIAVIAVALGVGALIGLLYGLLYTRFGVPSFVITLAGLLAFLGVQLLVLGQNGSINLPTESFIVQFALFSYLPPWLVYVLAALARWRHPVRGPPARCPTSPSRGCQPDRGRSSSSRRRCCSSDSAPSVGTSRPTAAPGRHSCSSFCWSS